MTIVAIKSDGPVSRGAMWQTAASGNDVLQPCDAPPGDGRRKSGGTANDEPTKIGD